jgi:hypothetical protein
MLSFLSPLFLIGAAASAIPIVLHLLRREPEVRVKFPAVALLKKAPVEYTERRRLRELLLLVARIAVLVLLAAGFARPFLAANDGLGTAGVTVIALDTSASMSVPGAFERAKLLAREAVDRVPSGGRIGVMTFADVATSVAEPSADRAAARSAIDAATQGFGAARYRGVLGVAVQAFGDRAGTIVLVTDLQENGWDAGDRASVPASTRLEIVDVGSIPSNLAVTAIRSSGDRIVASIRNTGDASRETQIHLALDGRSAGEAKVAIGPRTSTEVEFTPASKARSAAISIVDPTGVQADNVRYAVLGTSRSTVLVVTATGDLGREAFYVQQAFHAGRTSRGGYQVEGVGAAQLSTWDGARLSQHVALLLMSTRGLERRGRETLAAYTRGGGGILIAAGPDIDGEVVADVLGGGAQLRLVPPARQGRDEKPVSDALVPVDARHPVFQVLAAGASTLGLVKFHRAASIAGQGCLMIARFTAGAPALLECPAGEGRALVLASDLDGRWNDFQLHATFVPFLNESIRYLASVRPRPMDEYLVGDVPSGIAPTPGVITMPAVVASSATQIAVNIDPRESESARLSVEDFQAAVTRLKDDGRVGTSSQAGDQEDRQHLWQYLLVLTIGMLALEGLIASRSA